MPYQKKPRQNKVVFALVTGANIWVPVDDEAEAAEMIGQFVAESAEWWQVGTRAVRKTAVAATYYLGERAE